MKNNKYHSSFRVLIRIEDLKFTYGRNEFLILRDKLISGLGISEESSPYEITNIQKKLKDLIQIAVSEYNSLHKDSIEAFIVNYSEQQGSLILGFDLLIFSVLSFGSCYESASFIIDMLGREIEEAVPSLTVSTSHGQNNQTFIAQNNPLHSMTLTNNNDIKQYLKSSIWLLTALLFGLFIYITILRSEIQSINDKNAELAKGIYEKNKEMEEDLKEYITNKTDLVIEASRSKDDKAK